MMRKRTDERRMRKAALWIGAVLLGTLGLAGAAWCAPAPGHLIAEPVLVTQPAYAGMSFYVYRPYNMPAGWFVTFDGYPVMKAKDGKWIYGFYDGKGIVPSGYVVGSVVPGAVQLMPLFPSQGAAPSPGTVQPQSEGAFSPGVVVQAPADVVAAAPPSVPVTAVASAVPVVPWWMVHPTFLEVSRWNALVDRMAILDKPRVPIAWKGDAPSVLFAWTGKSWYAMKSPGDGLGVADILRHNIYSLVRMVNQNGFLWNDAETPALANQATIWGYLWMGHLALGVR
ncbi:hypothetical protein [Aminiphilus circumscriptus]|uniref:hypothetical protein n=1 Tax=Aminiphilus circumscriptus TaxID=290732 RepID=UPI0012FBA540|nr:hypothetical protein [Aminiphilus circumscriptus]